MLTNGTMNSHEKTVQRLAAALLCAQYQLSSRTQEQQEEWLARCKFSPAVAKQADELRQYVRGLVIAGK